MKKEMYKAKVNGKIYFFEFNYGGLRLSQYLAQQLNCEFVIKYVKVDEQQMKKGTIIKCMEDVK